MTNSKNLTNESNLSSPKEMIFSQRKQKPIVHNYQFYGVL